jgi:hypothetical protein
MDRRILFILFLSIAFLLVGVGCEIWSALMMRAFHKKNAAKMTEFRKKHGWLLFSASMAYLAGLFIPGIMAYDHGGVSAPTIAFAAVGMLAGLACAVLWSFEAIRFYRAELGRTWTKNHSLVILLSKVFWMLGAFLFVFAAMLKVLRH